MNSIFTEQNGLNQGVALPDIRYYTYEEASKILRCSEKTLYNRVKSGQVKPLYNGRRVLFTKECLDEFLQRGRKMMVKQRELQPSDMHTENPLSWWVFTELIPSLR